MDEKTKQTRDRLTKAFAKLRANGIYARANFWCCNTCASSAIFSKYLDNPKFQEKFKGYTFWHQQEDERLKKGINIWISHGSFFQDVDKDVEVANEIVDVLTKSGIQAKWDGNTGTKIEIQIEGAS